MSMSGQQTVFTPVDEYGHPKPATPFENVPTQDEMEWQGKQVDRIYNGQLNEQERQIPQVQMQSYAVANFLANELHHHVEDVNRSPRPYMDFYFGKGTSLDEAYQKSLAVRGHEDRLNPVLAAANVPPPNFPDIATGATEAAKAVAVKKPIKNKAVSTFDAFVSDAFMVPDEFSVAAQDVNPTISKDFSFPKKEAPGRFAEFMRGLDHGLSSEIVNWQTSFAHEFGLPYTESKAIGLHEQIDKNLTSTLPPKQQYPFIRGLGKIAGGSVPYLAAGTAGASFAGSGSGMLAKMLTKEALADSEVFTEMLTKAMTKAGAWAGGIAAITTAQVADASGETQYKIAEGLTKPELIMQHLNEINPASRRALLAIAMKGGWPAASWAIAGGDQDAAEKMYKAGMWHVIGSSLLFNSLSAATGGAGFNMLWKDGIASKVGGTALLGTSALSQMQSFTSSGGMSDRIRDAALLHTAFKTGLFEDNVFKALLSKDSNVRMNAWTGLSIALLWPGIAALHRSVSTNTMAEANAATTDFVKAVEEVAKKTGDDLDQKLSSALNAEPDPTSQLRLIRDYAKDIVTGNNDALLENKIIPKDIIADDAMFRQLEAESEQNPDKAPSVPVEPQSPRADIPPAAETISTTLPEPDAFEKQAQTEINRESYASDEDYRAAVAKYADKLRADAGAEMVAPEVQPGPTKQLPPFGVVSETPETQIPHWTPEELLAREKRLQESTLSVEQLQQIENERLAGKEQPEPFVVQGVDEQMQKELDSIRAIQAGEKKSGTQKLIEKQTGALPLLKESVEKAAEEGRPVRGASLAGMISRGAIETPTETPKPTMFSSAYKAMLSAAEKAGMAGYKRGLVEMKAKVQGLRDVLGDSITKSEALNVQLAALERGAEKGRAAERKALKAEQRISEKWQDADRLKVKEQMMEALNTLLPIEERGRFVNRIANALRRPGNNDPHRMYAKASAVVDDIEVAAHELQKKNMIGDIKDTFTRALESKSVDIIAKQKLQSLFDDLSLNKTTDKHIEILRDTRDWLASQIAAGHNTTIQEHFQREFEKIGQIPLSELPITSLEHLQNLVHKLEEHGKTVYASRQEAEAARINDDVEKIAASNPNKTDILKEQAAPPMKALTWWDSIKNRIVPLRNFYRTNFVYGPQSQNKMLDMIADSKGLFSGSVFDVIGNPVTNSENAAGREYFPAKDARQYIQRKYKLGWKEEQAIGLYMQARQNGGEERLIAESGVTKEDIEKARDFVANSEGSQAWIKQFDAQDARIFEEASNVLYRLHNIPLQWVEGHFPWMRDYDKYVAEPATSIKNEISGKPATAMELETLGRFLGDFVPANSGKLPQGFTLSREPHATTAIRFDAFKMANEYQRKAWRFIRMQEDLSHISSVLSDERMPNIIGTEHQKLLLDWISTVATDGNGANVHRTNFIDALRYGTVKSLSLFRVQGWLKHSSSIPLGIYHGGGLNWWYRALSELYTKEGQEFMAMFPDISRRTGGGSITQEELGQSKTARIGGIGYTVIDRFVSQATFLSRFLKEMAADGREPTVRQIDIRDAIKSGTRLNEIANIAENKTTRAVASTMKKDMPPWLSRGYGFGGDVSKAKAIQEFSTYKLERYSNFRDLYPVFSRDPAQGFGLMGTLFATVAWENSLKIALGAAGYETEEYIRQMIGNPRKKKEDVTFHEKLVKDSLQDVVSWVPYASQIMSAAQYGESGVPVIDTLIRGGKALGQVFTAKTGEGRNAAYINAVMSAFAAKGIYGTPYLDMVLKQMFVNEELKRKQAGEAAAETRRKKYEAAGPSPVAY